MNLHIHHGRFLFLSLTLAFLMLSPIPGSAQPTESASLEIYLLEEPHFYGIHFRTFGTPPVCPGLDTLGLANLRLMDTPLLTVEHFEEYCTLDNTFELTSEGMGRIKFVEAPQNEPNERRAGGLLLGVPFIASVEGTRLFCGTFTSMMSSFHGTIGPTVELTRPWQCIYFRDHPPDPMNRDRCWSISWPDLDQAPHSRFSIPNARARFIDVFRRAGKLAPNCGSSKDPDGSPPPQG